MAHLTIQGGKRLHGTIQTSAGKNAPVALLCASLLIRGTVTLRQMTRVEEVLRMIEVLESIGVRIQWTEAHTIVLDIADDLDLTRINRGAADATRACLLLMGALSGRESRFSLPKSGGCHLGHRTIRPHLFALQELGMKITSDHDDYAINAKGLQSGHIVMYESGDTATENAILAAVQAEGETTIHFASANYMVQELCFFLQKAGAAIDGIGTTSLTITGGIPLSSAVEYTLSPDPVDAMAWLSLGVTTGSPITVEDCPVPFLELELQKLAIMGQQIRQHHTRKAPNGSWDLVDIDIIPSELTALPDKLYGRPYPGLNIDNVPLFTPVATQAKGQTLIHDWCYENRAIYSLELQKLGANVRLLDPHRALIEGRTALKGNEILCPPALRPGMAILIAMIAAQGQSILRHPYQIERGYEELVPRLQAVGVDITENASQK